MMDLTYKSPVDTRSQVFSFLQDDISETLYSLHSTQKQASEKLDGISKLAMYDPSLSLEHETSQLQAVLLNKSEFNVEKLADLFCQNEQIIQRLDVIDVLSWLTCFREFTKTHLANYLLDFGVDFSDKVYRITDSILSNYLQYSNKEWEPVLLMWLDILQNELKDIDMQKTKDLFIDLFDCYQLMIVSDSALFAIAKYIYFVSGSNLVSRNGVDFFRSKQEVMDALRQLCFSRDKSPKLGASIFMIRRCFCTILSEDIPEWLMTYIDAYRNTDLNEDLWKNLHLLLWEYVIIGQTDIVRDFMFSIKLNRNMLCSPEIHYYIALADTVCAYTFLKNVNKKAMSDFPKDPACCSIVVLTACSLIPNDELTNLSRLIKVINNQESFRRILRLELVGAAKLLILLYNHNKRLFEKGTINNAVVMQTIRQINKLYKLSPHTAIWFLQVFKPVIYYKIPRIDQLIGGLLVQASYNKQSIEVKQLTELLELYQSRSE